MRDFVRSHPSYKFDSVVSQEINYDLMVAVDEMCVSHAKGGIRIPDSTSPVREASCVFHNFCPKTTPDRKSMDCMNRGLSRDLARDAGEYIQTRGVAIV